MFNAPRTIDDPQRDSRRIRRCFFIATGFAAVLWLIKILESVLHLNLATYGIFPRSMHGLAGILSAPLIHGSWGHLTANTAPLIILGTALLYGYPRSSRIVIPAVYLGTGFCVWLFAREAWHIGASGLTFGFMLFVFTIGAIRWDKRAIALSMMVFFLYGGMLVGIIPHRQEVSFESHLAGAIIGLLLAILLRNTDPRPPQKKYSWDYEEESGIEMESVEPPVQDEDSYRQPR